MNEILNKLLFAGDKILPAVHLRQPGFTYSATRANKFAGSVIKNENISN